jgi:hypothetical protein
MANSKSKTSGPVRPNGEFAINAPDSNGSFQLARRVAGYVVTGHADLAYINTLAKVFCVEFLVPLGDASTLLIRILNFLRTRCDADGYCHQNNET